MSTIHTIAERLDRDVDRFYGKYRGLVADDADPSKRGRIRALVPEVLGTETSGWALPCAPHAGKGSGFFSIPAKDAGVWIEFEAGDPSRPVWVGTWWADGEAPAPSKGDPKIKTWRTEDGLRVVLDDKASTIQLSDADGKNLLTIKAKDGLVEVRAATKVVVEAPTILLGEGAGDPAVLGNALDRYLSKLVSTFNSHMHPGQQAGPVPVSPAPPTPMLSPPDPSLLSTKNQVQ